MDDIKLAMLGNKEAAKRLTDAGVLVPCPFCGSDNVAFMPDEEQFLENTTTGFIWCHGCDFTSDSFYSEKVAAEKWNRREAQP